VTICPAAPESLGMRMMKEKALTWAVGCTINGAQEAILDILAKYLDITPVVFLNPGAEAG